MSCFFFVRFLNRFRFDASQFEVLLGMNLEGGSFAGCVKHPSQFFTGFCSSCLVERLSNVDPMEKSPNLSAAALGEIVEISDSSSFVADSQSNKGSEVRVRRTLLSLFQLDDCNDASSSGDAHVDRKIDSLDDKQSKEKNSSFAKGLRWRSKSASKSGRFGGKQIESKRELGHSCDWRLCLEFHESHDSGKGGWEKPRHSWDGSMVSKALACSFACLEETEGGSSRIKRRLPEENVGTDANGCRGTVDVSKADDASLVDEKPSSPHGVSFGSLLRERHHEEFHQDMNVMDGSRKKSHRWSRVWDWSITSPFRDFVRKSEHGLERSLSGTWPEGHKSESSHSGTIPHGNGLHAPRASQCLSRNAVGGNGEIQKLKPEWQRKREYRFGRSRSVHYPSPGNMDNGMLRFYLTPMRTSRRSSNGRIRTSHFFPRILGH